MRGVAAALKRAAGCARVSGTPLDTPHVMNANHADPLVSSRPVSSRRSAISRFLERLAGRVTAAVGTGLALGLATGTVLAWLLCGPIVGWSDTWQLTINTGTTIVTFLMVFLIQRSQNKESRAIHLKLDEIVAAIDGASNRLIGVEDQTESDLAVLTRHYQFLRDAARRDVRLTESHSIDEAQRRHARKHGRRARSR